MYDSQRHRTADAFDFLLSSVHSGDLARTRVDAKSLPATAGSRQDVATISRSINHIPENASIHCITFIPSFALQGLGASPLKNFTTSSIW